ncbi:LexA/Signal peptidase [Ramicandelaber brevisporus]|nr:LexA/Signal peptidase [Ramicandelaber brevisporus]
MVWSAAAGAGASAAGGYFRRAFGYAASITKMACTIHFISEYLMVLSPTIGPSMLPTLNIHGDIVMVDRLSHRFGMLRPGDVVLYTSPLNPHHYVVKRLIGIAGDTVVLDPSESDLVERRQYTVPKGHVWLAGDNMNSSTDSRTYGPVPIGLIRGKVSAVVWPRYKRLRNEDIFVSTV